MIPVTNEELRILHSELLSDSTAMVVMKYHYNILCASVIILSSQITIYRRKISFHTTKGKYHKSTHNTKILMTIQWFGINVVYTVLYNVRIPCFLIFF